MKWNLSLKETGGVALVGLGVSLAANEALSRRIGREHQAILVSGGTLLYTLGVVIGTNRPQRGFLSVGYDRVETSVEG